MVLAVRLRHAERRLVARFRESGATAPERAVEVTAHDPIARLRLRRLVSRGAVRVDAQRRYYLDEGGYAAYRAARRRRAAVLIALVLAAALGAYLWQSRR